MRKPLAVSVLVTCVLGTSPSVVRAEKVDMSPAQLRETATHVIVGTVGRVYTEEEQEGDWLYTHFVAEVAAENFEKGEKPATPVPIYARYWTRSWTGGGPPPPSTNGHRGLPSKGDRLRIYLARNAYDGFTRENHDGGFNVIGANGFERL